MKGKDPLMNYITSIRKLIKELSQYHIGLHATNASFYIILSVFPTIMLIAALLPTFGVGAHELLEAMEGIVPEILYPLFQKVIQDMEGTTTGVLLSATAVVAVWSASKGVYCIQQGLNAVYGVRESRSYLLNRLNSMVYTLLLILSLLLTLAVSGFGRTLVHYLSTSPVPILKILAWLLRMRGVILMLLLTVLFTAIYCVFPNRKQSIPSELPGAAMAALSWLIFTGGYSLYARFSGSYSLLYGSLSIIAMGMVWLYICISILFYGCVLNIYLERK